MNPHHHFVANNLFSGDFAKFNDWNENIYIELVDELSQDERKNLKKEFDTYKYPRDFYAHCLDDGVQKVFDFLEQYKGCCTIPKSKRNIKLIYAAIITCQATRALYAEVLEFIGNSSEFKKNNQPNEGNAMLASYAFNTIFIATDEINYWPFSLKLD